MPVLHITTSGFVEKTVDVPETGCTIGRAWDNVITFNDEDVSAYHAALYCDGGGFFIEDRNSTNGTYLNHIKINRSPVQGGDVISICRNTIRFESFCAKEGADDENVAKVLTEADRHLMHGRWDSAESAVQKALLMEQGNSQALQLQDRIARKKNMYRKLESLVVPGKKDTLSIVGPDDFVSLNAAPFEIRFHISRDAHLIKEIFKTLKRAYDLVGRHLEVYPERVEVEVYTSQEELQGVTGLNGCAAPDWAAGMCDEKIRINTDDDTLREPQFLYLMLTHEYVHYAVRHMTGGKCPLWLEEGIAQVETQNAPAGTEELLQRALDNDAFLPLEILQHDFSALEYAELIDFAYVEAYSIVTFLLQRYSWSGIRAVLGAFGSGEEVPGALGRVHLSCEELEQAWKEWLPHHCCR